MVSFKAPVATVKSLGTKAKVLQDAQPILVTTVTLEMNGNVDLNVLRALLKQTVSVEITETQLSLGLPDTGTEGSEPDGESIGDEGGLL